MSWDIPDTELLDLLQKIVVENNLWSQAIDLFYNKERGYLVNEMQCFWGSKNPHQMIRNGVPGRFTYKNGSWVFEDGEFEIASFEEDFTGYVNEGEFDEDGFFFDAEYEAYNDDLDKYEFDIQGILILGDYIAGIIDVEYLEWDIWDWDEEESAKAYFIGIKD